MSVKRTATLVVVLVLRASVAHAQPLCTATFPTGHGSISGKVTTVDNPSAGVPGYVFIMPIGAGPLGSSAGLPPDTGVYAIGTIAAPATYLPLALPSDKIHAPEFLGGALTKCAARLIHLTDGAVVDDADFNLKVGGTVSGTVTAEDGVTPLENVEVKATLIGDLPHEVKVRTDASGHYSITGLAFTTYQIQFTPDPFTFDNYYLTEVYDNKFSTPGDPVTITEGGVTIDASLDQGGRIEGHVTLAAGFSFGTTVRALTDGPYQFGTASSFSDSGYSMVVAPGTYKVLAFPVGPSVAELYDGKHDLASADEVTVSKLTTTSDIDIELDETALIYGNVTDAVSGTGINANVLAIDENGIDVPFASGAQSELRGGGDYIIEINLHTGQYKLKFSAPGHLTEFYSDKPTQETADPVSVTAPELTNHINAALEPCEPTTTTIESCVTTSLPATTTTLTGGSQCGDPVALVAGDDSGTLPRSITASDALSVLRAAVGSATCDRCVCDVNDSGGITASDALIVLRRAVGQPIELHCPACA